MTDSPTLNNTASLQVHLKHCHVLGLVDALRGFCDDRVQGTDGLLTKLLYSDIIYPSFGSEQPALDVTGILAPSVAVEEVWS